MRRTSFPVALNAIALLLGMATDAGAGPVQQPSAAPADTAPTAAPAPAAIGEPLTTAIRPWPAASAADAGAEVSSAELAAQMIEEADAKSQVFEAPRQRAPARPHAPTSAAAQRVPSDDEDGLDLRATGKAAVLWVKQSLPWLRDEEGLPEETPAAMLPVTDWGGAPAGGDASAAGATLVTLTGAGSGATKRGATLSYAAASRTAADAEENSVRAALSFIRMVVEHPMTWLMVSLVVVGSMVAKRIDRRPDK